MSPNNLVLVAHMGGMSYVFPDANADTEWSTGWVRGQISSGQGKLCKRRRAAALVLAHNIQNRMRTEYGVREVFLDKRRCKILVPIE